MGDVADFLATLDGSDLVALEHVYAVAREVVPAAEEGTSYAMPSLLHHGKGLVSVARAKRFLSLYPFSGRVVAELRDELAGFETTKGSIHFSAARPIPDDVLRRIIETRRDEIEASLRRR
ncbi:MAG: DUF1801 domain-containing protein [Nocardioidaceae bacterium]|nr:DUF1801 domain-containing protein [Nocardioidaceae bacterium]